MKFCHDKLDLGAVHGEDFVILACTVLIQLTSVTDGRTDRQTDGRPDDGKDAQSILLSRVKMINVKSGTKLCDHHLNYNY